MVSIGFMQATPGDMKSFRSSAERMALMVGSRRKWDSGKDRERRTAAVAGRAFSQSTKAVRNESGCDMEWTSEEKWR